MTNWNLSWHKSHNLLKIDGNETEEYCTNLTLSRVRVWKLYDFCSFCQLIYIMIICKVSKILLNRLICGRSHPLVVFDFKWLHKLTPDFILNISEMLNRKKSQRKRRKINKQMNDFYFIIRLFFPTRDTDCNAQSIECSKLNVMRSIFYLNNLIVWFSVKSDISSRESAEV